MIYRQKKPAICMITTDFTDDTDMVKLIYEALNDHIIVEFLSPS